MSLLQDFEKYRKELGIKYYYIEVYLSQHPFLDLGMLYCNPKDWQNFEEWYKENSGYLVSFETNDYTATVNPFTGNLINSSLKKDGVYITLSDIFMPHQQKSKNVFDIKDHEWYKVKDNIFIDSNWTQEVPQ